MSSGAQLFDELVRSRTRSRVAAKLLATTRHEGRTILVLKDPGGEPLDRILERDEGQPLDLTRFLHSVTPIGTAFYMRKSGGPAIPLRGGGSGTK